MRQCGWAWWSLVESYKVRAGKSGEQTVLGLVGPLEEFGLSAPWGRGYYKVLNRKRAMFDLRVGKLSQGLGN